MIPPTPVSDVQAASAPTTSEHPLIGQVVGERYRIEALLGEGGMGAVFRARHLTLDRPVALKVLHARLCEDAQVQKRFEREALAISKLDHPNCVRVMDFGTSAEGMKYLVMPFLDGQELRDLTGVALPLHEVVDLGAQILRALEHAHKRGLVHRDLKPENVFLVRGDEDDRVVKLVDFGIVKLLESDGLAQLTRAGMAFGTPTYMSPEQAAGGKIDERTDLYSLGVMLYELLTGVPPFTADEPAMLMRMHILADPPPLPDTVPKPLADVVTKLLGKEPHERYANAREARHALVAALSGATASTPSSGEVVVPPLVVPAASEPATVHDGPAAPAAAGLPDAVPAVMPDAMAAAVPPAEASAPALLVRSGGTVLASSSMSQGAAPVGGVAAFDGLAAASGPVPRPSAVPFGAVPMPMPVPSPHAGGHGVASMPRRASGRGGIVLLFVALSFVVWATLAWMWMRDDPSDAASSQPAAPAKGPAGRPSAGGMPAAAVAAPAEGPALSREERDAREREADKWREERRREAEKRRAEQKRVAEQWRQQQRRAAEK